MSKKTNRFDMGDIDISWCPGCGDYPILSTLKETLVELDIKPKDLVMVSGIGQAAKIPQYLNCNYFNGLHGRSLPAAWAIKAANPNLVVIAESGDGCSYGEGGNHLIHGIRRNLDITYLVHNNQIYGLTKGQASPTSEKGFISKTTPAGVILQQLNPLALAISLGATFVARGFTGRLSHLTKLIVEGIQHPGFALIDVLQPCVSFNHVNTYAWYTQRVYNIDEDAEYDSGNPLMAYQKALEWGDRIPIGVLYQSKKKTYEEQVPALQSGPLVSQSHDLTKVRKLFKDFIP